MVGAQNGGPFKQGQRPWPGTLAREGSQLGGPMVVESSSLSAGRSSPVVLGPQEFLAFPTRSFTQDFSYTANINYGCRQASTPTTAVEFSGENMS